MDSERQRVQDDLRGLIRGDVHCDPVTTMLFASDASIYQVSPLAVVRPRSIADVAATVGYAASEGYSVHPRGAGSGVAGESLGSGIVMDMSRFMRRIRPLDDAEKVHVDAGATLAETNRTLRTSGRWYGPDPITRSITTMGSVVARNACGSHYLRSGSARDTVETLRMVTAEGETVELGKHLPDDDSIAGRFAKGVAEVHHRYRDALSAAGQVHFQPASDFAPPGGLVTEPSDSSTAAAEASDIGGTSSPIATTPMVTDMRMPKRRRLTPGYRIDDVVLDDGRVDLAKFFAGTQGTLGIITDAVLRTEPVPTHRGVVLAFFHRLDMAVRTSIAALDAGVIACDWMDRRLLQIARGPQNDFRDLVPAAAEAMLLVEIQGESLGDLYDRLSAMRSLVSRGPDGAFDALDTMVTEERDRYWSLYRQVIPRLYRLQGDEAPQPFVEDIRLSPEVMIDAIADLRGVLRQAGTTATMFAQMGRESLHLRPFLNLARGEDRKRLMQLSASIAEVVWRHGGEIATEHSAGLSKTWLLPTQYGTLWPAMGQVKRLFDPQGRLNPGKMFGSMLQHPNENLRPSQRHLEVTAGDRVLEEPDAETARRFGEGDADLHSLPVLQHWPPGGEVSRTARLCNGCGRCRTTAPDARQCPVFRALPSEEATPRAKANLLRAVISGQLSVTQLTDAKAKAIADLCFNCHQCRLECPASVDIPKIVGELKAQYVAGNGQTMSDFFLSRIDSVASLGSRVPWLFNRMIASPLARWIAERTLGLSAARPLPTVSRETFLRHAGRRRLGRRQDHGGLKVCYFVDHYANHHDPSIGRAVAEVLQQNEIGLYVPMNQSASGMARITLGDIPSARKVARRNVRILADAVRAGYEIVTTEPAALLCLKHEYPNLLGTEDSLLVADHTDDIASYLWKLHQSDRLSLAFDGVPCTVAYHHPCHLRVIDPEPAAVSLLGLIPELNVHWIEAGCSGMAGTWGLQRKNYRASLRIGWPLISSMRTAPVRVATTGCGACRMQIEHGSGRQTVHPIKILAYAYRRMPKVGTELLLSDAPPPMSDAAV